MRAAPLVEAVEKYIRRDTARFHMPGHKGKSPIPPGCLGEFYDTLYSRDLTEAQDCGSLYEGGDCIAETESLYAELFGSARSLISAGGSTLCVQTMLALALKPGDKLICGRGCHKSAINLMALLDLRPHWVFPETDTQSGLAKAVSAMEVKKALAAEPEARAVYVTSPDYYGAVADVAPISAVCREHGVPLLADNAHGAILRFLTPSLHPINLGAAMCCDSLHKTLPVLTGGAMLHIADSRYIENAKRYMSMFGSTSPSYIVMASIDAALPVLDDDFCRSVTDTAKKLAGLKYLAAERGFTVPEFEICDPMRLTLGFTRMGYTRAEFCDRLHESGVEPELVTEGFCVFMASPYNGRKDFRRLESFIARLPAKEALSVAPPILEKPRAVMTPREAAFAPHENIAAAKSAGRVAGCMSVPCPPGIPLLVPGEIISENLALFLERYGVFSLNVLK